MHFVSYIIKLYLCQGCEDSLYFLLDAFLFYLSHPGLIYHKLTCVKDTKLESRFIFPPYGHPIDSVLLI